MGQILKFWNNFQLLDFLPFFSEAEKRFSRIIARGVTVIYLFTQYYLQRKVQQFYALFTAQEIYVMVKKNMRQRSLKLIFFSGIIPYHISLLPNGGGI